MSHADYWIGDSRETMRRWAAEGGIPTPWGPQQAHLILTSPPFLALRSYLPADDPNKPLEMGSEPTPAAFLDALLDWTAACAEVLSPEGSLAVELGDTYSGSGGAGGDYADGGQSGESWPLAKCKAMIPELYRVALAYGINPLTGQPSPAGRWRVRNVVTWCRPNPPVGALGDKYRPATSDLVIACRSENRWFDLDAVRTPSSGGGPGGAREFDRTPGKERTSDLPRENHPAGAPPLDWWEISTEPYAGSHYATWPRRLCEIPIKSMCPTEVAVSTGKGRRRIVWSTARTNLGWTDTDPNSKYRPGIVLDPFAGSGTTLAVATGHGRHGVGIDLDRRNADLAAERVGPLLLTVQHVGGEV